VIDFKLYKQEGICESLASPTGFLQRRSPDILLCLGSAVIVPGFTACTWVYRCYCTFTANNTFILISHLVIFPVDTVIGKSTQEESVWNYWRRYADVRIIVSFLVFGNKLRSYSVLKYQFSFTNVHKSGQKIFFSFQLHRLLSGHVC
jgi:hypothetical protein